VEVNWLDPWSLICRFTGRIVASGFWIIHQPGM